MEFPDLHLEEFSFSSAPTKTQLVNVLRSMHSFLSRVGGAVIADGQYTIADQALATMLNGSITLKAAADQFEAGPNQQGIVHAMPAPPANMAGPRRV